MSSAAASSSNSSTTHAPSNSSTTHAPDDPFKPLWAYVAKIDDGNLGGGNVGWVCSFCGKESKSSYTRVKAHLLNLKGAGISGCPKVSTRARADMQKLDDEASQLKIQSKPKIVPLPPHLASFGNPYESNKRRKGGSLWSESEVSGTRNSIGKAFNNQTRDLAHAHISRMFYSAGLPFHLARNPYFVNALTFLANNNLSGYLPPGYNMLRGPLLQKEKVHVEKLLEPTRSTWKEKGVSIVSDGWSDSQRRPLINFIAMSAEGPMFLKAVDCSGEVKDKYFISNLMKEVIKEVGEANVVQVITDNAANCKAAGQLIEGEFPTISWTPCVVHTLNLALKNICAAKNVENNRLTYDECSWITDLAGDVVQIKNFIMNHSMRLAIFNEFSSLKLLSVADTRFASVIVMLRRFKLIKNSLQAMVISDKWVCYRDDNMVKARFVRDTILDDTWWDKLNYIIAFTNPIYDIIRACDTDKPCLHLVYDMWDTMIGKVKSAIYKYEKRREDDYSSFYEVVHKILVDRWQKNNTLLHCMAHSLNPR